MFFSENSAYHKTGKGWIEVITGGMFSGKTEELIRRLKKAQIANQKTIIFKPVIDTRYSQAEVVSHDDNKMESVPVNHSEDIILQTEDSDVIGIDEAQFFDEGITNVCNKLADSGKRVIVAGLDLNYKRLPFSPMPELMAMADFITKLHAVCIRCGNQAMYSNRKIKNDNQPLLGGKDTYEPLCRDCYMNENANLQ